MLYRCLNYTQLGRLEERSIGFFVEIEKPSGFLFFGVLIP